MLRAPHPVPEPCDHDDCSNDDHCENDPCHETSLPQRSNMWCGGTPTARNRKPTTPDAVAGPIRDNRLRLTIGTRDRCPGRPAAPPNRRVRRRDQLRRRPNRGRRPPPPAPEEAEI